MSFQEATHTSYSTVQYWFVASIANGMLWAQIIIGAAITALGATHASGSKTATIYLGAASTVIAGFLTYFKSRSQPVRSRQFRQALRKVRNKMGKASPPDFLRGHISTVSWVNRVMDLACPGAKQLPLEPSKQQSGLVSNRAPSDHIHCPGSGLQ
jgi:hypothetical protein